MSNYTWTPAARFDGEGAVLAADIADSIRAVLYIEYQDGLKVSLAIHGEDVRGRLDGVASTDRPEDWDEVERFIPRAEWPAEIYAGRRGPAERTPDAAVAAAIAQACTELDVE